MSSRRRKVVSSRRSFVSSPSAGRNIVGLLRRRREPRSGSEQDLKEIGGGAGTGPACGAARGALEGFMPRIALYPGSFDPVTNGHLDVVRHAVVLCDRLIVAVGVNSSKKPLFSTEERLDMVREVFAPVAAKAGCAFDCTTYDNLTVTAAQKNGATIMIRGLRDGTDLDFEMQIAGMNETLAPHWCAKSQPWAATCRRSCRNRSRPASRPNSPASPAS